jgi:hypothetical protein
MLRGVSLTSTSQLVFQLWMAKPGVAGLPTKEVLVAWTAAPVLQQGQVGRALAGRGGGCSCCAVDAARPRGQGWQLGSCHVEGWRAPFHTSLPSRATHAMPNNKM